MYYMALNLLLDLLDNPESTETLKETFWFDTYARKIIKS